MDNPSINRKSQHCQKHNHDKNDKNLQCEGCLLEKSELITFEQIQKKCQETIFNDNKKNDSQLEQLFTLRDGIINYKQIIIRGLDKSIQQIIDQIKIIKSQQQQMQQLDDIMNKYKSIDDLTTYLNNNQKTNIQFRSQILMNLLLDFKSNVMRIDFLHSILSQKQQIILQTPMPKQQKRLKNIEYELIQQVKCKESIYDFTIDQRNNILMVGMENGYIKIYHFSNGKIGIEIQSLQAHADDVIYLYCMKNTPRFLFLKLQKQIQQQNYCVIFLSNAKSQTIICLQFLIIDTKKSEIFSYQNCFKYILIIKQFSQRQYREKCVIFVDYSILIQLCKQKGII